MGSWRRHVVVVALLAACHNGESPPRDAASDGLVIPDGLVTGEAAGTSAVDFVVQGCSERTLARCSGSVPLRLTFSALLQAAPSTTPRWDLGDGSDPEEGQVVTHTYQKPGLYDVALAVGGATGTVSALKPGFVEVHRAVAGAPCGEDGDCVSERCVCRSGYSCGFPLDQGLCLEECELACQGEGMNCVDLSLANGEPWRTHLCLPECDAGSDCMRPGFGCKEAPGVKGWRKACVPALLRTIGEPCRRAEGTVDPAACIGGLCVDLGAAGYCSWACKAGTCPEGTRCTQLQGNATPICLARCGPLTECQADPLLACELPGGAGPYGFVILGSQEPQGTRFCAAKICTSDQGCGLGGACVEGYCQAK